MKTIVAVSSRVSRLASPQLTDRLIALHLEGRSGLGNDDLADVEHRRRRIRAAIQGNVIVRPTSRFYVHQRAIEISTQAFFTGGVRTMVLTEGETGCRDLSSCSVYEFEMEG